MIAYDNLAKPVYRCNERAARLLAAWMNDTHIAILA